MSRIKVVIAEDSLTVRKRLVEIVSADPELELVGEAADGKEAVELVRRHRPDVLSMDMMMPLMTGLAATEYIMAHFPTPILVVSASINRGELFRTYDALAAGAVDVIEKFTGDGSDDEWAKDYLTTLKLVSRIRVITHPRGRLTQIPSAQPSPSAAVPIAPSTQQKYSVAAIGASTGGPGAILDVLNGLPDSFSLPILFVLHISEPFGTAFADWLDGQTARRVSYAKEGDLVSAAAGKVLMAPPGQHLSVRDGRLRLSLEAERHSCRPSVDVLFESIARDYGPAACAALLTGMGRDGAEGLLKIRQAGGLTVAQDEVSSVIYGMPREAALLGAATHILPLSEIGSFFGRVPASPMGQRR
jgi:two-component system chemotaxis response regulator CheB